MADQEFGGGAKAQAIYESYLAEAEATQILKESSNKDGPPKMDNDVIEARQGVDGQSEGSQSGEETDDDVNLNTSGLSGRRDSLAHQGSPQSKKSENSLDGSCQDQDPQVQQSVGEDRTEALEWRSLLQEAWKFKDDEEATDDPKRAEKLFKRACSVTHDLMLQMMDSVIKDGLQGFKQADMLRRELATATETNQTMLVEVQRLREGDANNKKAIQSLLQARDKAKASAADASKTVLEHAELRAKIHTAMSEKEKVEEDFNDLKRKQSLMAEENKQLKLNMSKMEQRNIILERDLNASMSWAKSVDNGMSSDCDFYKRKVADQNTQIQGLQAVLAEKNSQIQELRRQQERSMSINRVDQMRAAQVEHRPAKKARKRASY